MTTRFATRREVLLLCAAGAVINLVAILLHLQLDSPRVLVVLNGFGLGLCLRVWCKVRAT